MECDRITFSRHALQRMFERSVTLAEVRAAITAGESVEEYPDDKPYPSVLLLALLHSRPLHVLVAKNPVSEECQVVTVYVPDFSEWNDDFRTRRRS